MRLLLRVLLPLAAWELVGDLHLVAQGALPAPSAIALQWWQDRDVYPQHLWATLWPALIGFLVGNLAAAIAASLFVLMPAVERLMRGFNVAVFAIPPIALSPVLVITLPGHYPQVVLAAVSVYFPTMVMTLLAMQDIDARSIDVIRSYGGRTLAVWRWLRLRSAVPGLLGGFRAAAPAAILGAILAEFGSGSRWGLGSFLLGSLGRANPARIWGIGLAATLMSAAAYGLCAWLAGRSTRSLSAVTIASGRGTAHRSPSRPAWREALLAAGAVLVPLLAWWLILAGFHVSTVVARTPAGVWQYLVSSPDAPEARLEILVALKQSLPPAGIGLLIALATALALAVLGMFWRALAALLMPAALLLQSMPLVALTPIISLLFGRGMTTTLIITVVVTFFPAYIIIAQGLAQVPAAAFDLLAVYGARPWQKLLMVSLPMSLPYVCAAARLVAPAALLGVMIAEWLITGYGLGSLLNTARGEMDYGMIWAVAFVAVAVSIGAYAAVKLLEDRLLLRFGSAAGPA